VSDYEAIQRRRNILVGIFLIIGLCALGWLIFKFGELPTVVSKIGSYQVFVQFPSAPGVQRDTPVRFCGYQIGRVTHVMPPEERRDLITGRKYHQTVAILNIDERYSTIPSNVEVKLMTRGLGSSYIELTVDPEKLPAPPKDPNRPETRYLVDQMWLQGSTGVTSEFFPVESQKKLDELVSSLITLIANANDVIGDPNNKQNIKKTFANLALASQQAAERLQQAKQILEQAYQTLVQIRQTVAKAEPAIEKIGTFAETATTTFNGLDTKADKLVAALIDTSEQLGRSAAELRLVLEKINSGQGTIGRFVNDAKLYEKLLEDAERIKMLLTEIKNFVETASRKGVPIKLK